MWVVFKIKHYWGDESEVNIIAVCNTKKKAKQIAEENHGDYKQAPFYN